MRSRTITVSSPLQTVLVSPSHLNVAVATTRLRDDVGVTGGELPEREDEGVVSTRDKADLRCAYSSATGEAMLRPGQAGFATD